MSSYLNLITYFGGKSPHLKWLLPHFPRGNYHFVDIMAGSANVALNINYPLITINDINDDVVNLFYVLREHYEEFIKKIYFTPFSRTELNRALLLNLNPNIGEVEKARNFFLRCQLGWGANGSQNNHKGAGFEYAIQKTKYYRVDNWNFKLDKLQFIAEKLRSFQIENRDALLLFDKVNKPGTIVYFDPPYLLSERKSKKRYKHEQTDDFHIALSKKLKDAVCHVAISGYDNPLYHELFKGFYFSKGPVNKSNNGKIPRQECLWTNYNPQVVNGVFKLEL